MELVLVLVFFLAIPAIKIGLWIWRAKEAAGPGGDPHKARALEDSFKDENRERRPPGDRQIAGEDCVECDENIVAEKEGTVCGVCNGLLHRKSCASRHICKTAKKKKKKEDAQPYRG